MIAMGQGLKGVVVDEATQEPLIGVTVATEKGHTGTITNIDGEFTIAVSVGTPLKVSYMGYVTQSVKASANMRIVLKETSQELSDVVVIGYGVQRKSDITGAISSVSAKDLTAAPVANTVQALAGRAAGVQVMTNTGAPGGSTTIKIRGTGTVNDSDPLYVVDGFIVNNIDHLNPYDIQNVEVLKDAASSSIYGARSANGVVLITTKGGQSGKMKITLDTYWGISNPWKEIKVMGVEDFALMRDYNTGLSNYSSDGQLYYSKDAEGNYYFDEGKKHRLDSISANSPDSWWNAVTRTGFKHLYNLSVSGGTDKTKFMVSGNYYGENGVVRTSDYERVSLRMNLTNKLTRWLSLRTSLLYTSDDRSLVSEGQNSVLKRALNQSPLVCTYNAKGYWTEDHPLAQLARNHNQAKSNRIDANIDLTANINKYLTYQFKFSDYANFYNTYGFGEVGKLEEEFVIPDDMTSVNRVSRKTNKWEVNNLLTFQMKTGAHNIGITAGQTAEQQSIENISASKQGTSSNEENLRYLSAAFFGDRTSGGLTEWSALGYLGRVNYSFNDTYLLQVNFRADASSKFHKNERWGYFPSASVGWRFFNEPFMKSLKWLSNGKLRLGWGILGNNRIGDYARYTILNNDLNYSYGTGAHVTQSGVAATSMGNDHIKWEKTKSYNIGLDLGFLDNRLTASFELYTKRTDDMLLNVPVTNAAGLVTAPMVNAGSVDNKGLEIQMAWKDRVGKDFRYEVGFNISFNKNKVVSLGTGNEPVYGAYLNENSILNYVTKTEVGRPIACFFGYVTDGIFQTMDEIQNSAQNDGVTKPGDFRFKDLNNDGKIDSEDRTYLGSPHPDFTFGVPMTFGYKDLELTVFLQGQVGNDIFNVMEYYLNSNHGTGNVYTELRQNHWAGDYVANRSFWPANPTASVPDLRQADNSKNYRASDFYVKNGSYMRLKDVRLSYNVPQHLVSKLHLQGLQAYISAYNLLTFTKYNGLDPEVGRNSGSESNNLYMGVDHGNYPQARNFTFGLNLTF